MFQAGGLVVVLVEVMRKAYLASIVPVIVNAILSGHQLVVDIIAFVSRGDFPRSRLGEKQRGKILASWVTRKMRTIAQFRIRDSEHADSQITEVAAETGSRRVPSTRNGSLVASSLGHAHSLSGAPTRQASSSGRSTTREYAPLPTGISEMPAGGMEDRTSAEQHQQQQLNGVNRTSIEDNSPITTTDVHAHHVELPDSSLITPRPRAIDPIASTLDEYYQQDSPLSSQPPEELEERQQYPLRAVNQFEEPSSSSSMREFSPRMDSSPPLPALPRQDIELDNGSYRDQDQDQERQTSERDPRQNQRGSSLWSLPSQQRHQQYSGNSSNATHSQPQQPPYQQQQAPPQRAGGLRAVNIDSDEDDDDDRPRERQGGRGPVDDDEEEWPQEALMHMNYAPSLDISRDAGGGGNGNGNGNGFTTRSTSLAGSGSGLGSGAEPGFQGTNMGMNMGMGMGYDGMASSSSPSQNSSLPRPPPPPSLPPGAQIPRPRARYA